MNLVARYTIERANCVLFELELPCDVTQDSGSHTLGELCVIWSAEADALIARYGFSGEECDGAVEAAEELFWESEREECRVSKARQQTGERAA